MNALTAPRAPQTLDTMMRMAELLANSTMVPKDYQRNPGNCLVAIQWGSEIGLAPMQAMQNIAVINGRPSIWGDAAAALVKGHPSYEWMREGVSGEGDARAGWCEIKRRGHDPERREFSVAHAKKANLWGKAGPWQQYPDRMLQLRARGFALRDVFPDALRGVITAEEAQDMPADAPRVVGVALPEAPAIAAPSAMDNPNTMQSLTISALREQLANLEDAGALRTYLALPEVSKARARAERAGRLSAWEAAVQEAWDRVTPPDDETTAPADEDEAPRDA